MKKYFFCFLLFLPLAGFSQTVIPAGVYAWPVGNTGSLFKGQADVLENLEVTANMVETGKTKTTTKVAYDEEQLLLIKAGKLTIHLNGSTFAIGKGSIAMILPGEQYAVENSGSQPAQYYLMKYKAEAMDPGRGKSAGGSFVKDWDKLEFRPHARGGVRPYFERPTSMSKRFEMHVTTLNPGLSSHDPHTHTSEEIILILEGNTEMHIDKNIYKAKEGDLVFVTSKSLHGIRNAGDTPCSYFAFQWE
jgi:(S)-ureidoglycine aminohydrolase